MICLSSARSRPRDNAKHDARHQKKYRRTINNAAAAPPVGACRKCVRERVVVTRLENLIKKYSRASRALPPSLELRRIASTRRPKNVWWIISSAPPPRTSLWAHLWNCRHHESSIPQCIQPLPRLTLSSATLKPPHHERFRDCDSDQAAIYLVANHLFTFAFYSKPATLCATLFIPHTTRRTATPRASWFIAANRTILLLLSVARYGSAKVNLCCALPVTTEPVRVVYVLLLLARI